MADTLPIQHGDASNHGADIFTSSALNRPTASLIGSGTPTRASGDLNGRSTTPFTPSGGKVSTGLTGRTTGGFKPHQRPVDHGILPPPIRTGPKAQ